MLAGIFLWVLAGCGLLNLDTFQKHLLESIGSACFCSFQRVLLDVIHHNHWGHTSVYSLLWDTGKEMSSPLTPQLPL